MNVNDAFEIVKPIGYQSPDAEDRKLSPEADNTCLNDLDIAVPIADIVERGDNV